MIFALFGALAMLLGAGVLYLASPHQCATSKPLPARALRWAGWVALVAGQALLLTWAGPATALFIGFTLAMTVWSIVPLAAAWRISRQGAAR